MTSCTLWLLKVFQTIGLKTNKSTFRYSKSGRKRKSTFMSWSSWCIRQENVLNLKGLLNLLETQDFCKCQMRRLLCGSLIIKKVGSLSTSLNTKAYQLHKFLEISIWEFLKWKALGRSAQSASYILQSKQAFYLSGAKVLSSLSMQLHLIVLAKK